MTSKFAIKVMLQTDEGCGAKLVVDDRGDVIAWKMPYYANQAKERLAQRSDQPIICEFAVVPLDNPGWISDNQLYEFRMDAGYRGPMPRSRSEPSC